MNAYLDSSVLLREILDQKPRLREFDEIMLGVTSQLARVECFRALDRLRVDKRAPDEALATAWENTNALLERLHVLPLDLPVLERASNPFPTSLTTLDAVHLASALLYRDSQPADEPPIVFVTFDRALATCARATGFRVLGAAPPTARTRAR